MLLGFERGSECKQDDFEHQGMLCSPHRNHNGRKADGVFGRDNDVVETVTVPTRDGDRRIDRPAVGVFHAVQDMDGVIIQMAVAQ